MKCQKCGERHPTEDETGEYPGSAAPVRWCPTDVQWIELAEARVRVAEMAMHRAVSAHADAVTELKARHKVFAKTLTA